MIPLCLAYLATALLVATVPTTPILAFGPVVLILAAIFSPATGSWPPPPRG
jgi:hypothetical protein